MDMSEKDKLELEKRGDNPINYHSSANMPNDWRFSGGSISNSSLGLVPADAQMPLCSGEIIGTSSCSSATIVDSFGPGLWDHPTNSQNLGFCDINVHNHATTSNPLGQRKGGSVSLRSGIDHKAMDMGWNPPSSMLTSGIFLPGAPGMFPQNLSQFPADSAFIERAARFSCFNGGNFSDMVNPFGLSEPMGLCPRSGGLMQGPQGVFSGGGLQSISGSQGQKNVINVGEASKGTSLSAEQVAIEGSPLKNDRKSNSLVRSHDEAKQGVGGSGNESEEAEFSGGGQDNPFMLDGNGGELSARSLCLKKRKRTGQVEAAKSSPEAQQKAAQNPTSGSNNAAGKQGKQVSEASEPKEEYIHVRARRGQATNSHSLAERVRREKISERMKFLQDLVPGCSKVTGKAVMLDEIINYVQSLQRQVEFLSMKLATVNPRLDFNIESLLAKDILHSRTMPSSSLAFSPGLPMAYPPFSTTSHPGPIQSSFPEMDSNSDVLRRAITSQLTSMTGGFKEPTQLPNAWDDELHNVVQMGYGTSSPQEGQEICGPLPPGQMKAEL